MQRRANPWRPGRTACGVALSVAAHAAIALIFWHGAAPTEAPRPAGLQVRLIERSLQFAVAAAAAPVEATAKTAVEGLQRRAVARSLASASAPASAPASAIVTARATVEAEAPSLAEAINGRVFGLPRIDFGGPPSTGWMRASTPTPAQSAQPDPMARGHDVREAGRAQLVAALEQQLGALQTPTGDGNGSCALDTQTQPQLDCDNNALRDAITPQAGVLSGLLQAYRGIDSRASSLSIGFNQGRYQVSLALGVEPR